MWGDVGIALAFTAIQSHIRRTPVVEAAGAEFGLGPFDIVLKLELLQHSGSFKARGAFTNLLLRQVPTAGVVAASGGNHGVAVAFAAARLGIPARIFVPSVASPVKIDQIRANGAELIIAGDRYDDALVESRDWATRSGALAIHAFDQPETIIGQGTTALEFEEQDPRLDCVVAAVGGGGLIGGIAAWYSNRVRLIGVEPELAPTLTRALAAGSPVDAEAGGIAADSLAPKRLGEIGLSDNSHPCGARDPRDRHGNRACPTPAVEQPAHCGRARWRGRVRGPPFRTLRSRER